MLKFKEWVENVIGIDTNNSSDPQREIAIDPAIENAAFVEEIKSKVD
jgi:hypothetical protein